MKIMVVGGGGREHALIRKLKMNKDVTEIYALPGNAGIGMDATCVPIRATDIERIVLFAAEVGVDFAVIAPDDPLALGAVNRLNAIGIPCFGPTKEAAEIESSKVFAKHLMQKYGIPTAKYRVFDDVREAKAYIGEIPPPIVVKADGLALGKGVIIAETAAQAASALDEMMVDKKFGNSGKRVVIEEFLEGPEVSVLAFTDGKTVVPMVSSMDHKRIGNGDTGLNTGGMGAVAPNPFYTQEMADRCMREIFLPTVAAMEKEGRPFQGCLYFGLMLTKDGPKVIEYNCRFGDPETQVVLPLMETDLFTVMQKVASGELASIDIRFNPGACCCVVIASGGYPGAYEKGKVISFGNSGQMAEVFHSGTALDANGSFVTNGGRVLGVSAVGGNLKTAVENAYRAAGEISFDGAYMRQDIGARALRGE